MYIYIYLRDLTPCYYPHQPSHFELREENHCSKTQDLNTRTFLHVVSISLYWYYIWREMCNSISGSCIGNSETDTDGDVNADVWGCHSVRGRLHVCKGVGGYDYLLVVVRVHCDACQWISLIEYVMVHDFAGGCSSTRLSLSIFIIHQRFAWRRYRTSCMISVRDIEHAW